MHYANRAESKSAGEPNHAALQHAGLALVLVIVILFSAIEMARAVMSRPAATPDIIRID